MSINYKFNSRQNIRVNIIPTFKGDPSDLGRKILQKY